MNEINLEGQHIKDVCQLLSLTLKGAIIMSNKWLLTLAGSLLAGVIVTGCADDQDPAPPEETNDQLPDENGGSPVDENLDENMDPQGTEEGTEDDELVDEDNADNDDLTEEEGTEDPQGTKEEGNNTGTQEGTEDPQEENK